MIVNNAKAMIFRFVFFMSFVISLILQYNMSCCHQPLPSFACLLGGRLLGLLLLVAFAFGFCFCFCKCVFSFFSLEKRKTCTGASRKIISLFRQPKILVSSCFNTHTHAMQNKTSTHTKHQQPWQDHHPGVPPTPLLRAVVVAKCLRRRGSLHRCQNKKEGRKRRKNKIGDSIRRAVPLMGVQSMLRMELECAEGMG